MGQCLNLSGWCQESHKNAGRYARCSRANQMAAHRCVDLDRTEESIESKRAIPKVPSRLHLGHDQRSRLATGLELLICFWSRTCDCGNGNDRAHESGHVCLCYPHECVDGSSAPLAHRTTNRHAHVECARTERRVARLSSQSRSTFDAISKHGQQ